MQASRFPKTGSIAWGYLDSGGGEGLANLQDAFKKRGYTSAMWKKLGVNVEHLEPSRRCARPIRGVTISRSGVTR